MNILSRVITIVHVFPFFWTRSSFFNLHCCFALIFALDLLIYISFILFLFMFFAIKNNEHYQWVQVLCWYITCRKKFNLLLVCATRHLDYLLFLYFSRKYMFLEKFSMMIDMFLKMSSIQIIRSVKCHIIFITFNLSHDWLFTFRLLLVIHHHHMSRIIYVS